jgi:hypothetical protein
MQGFLWPDGAVQLRAAKKRQPSFCLWFEQNSALAINFLEDFLWQKQFSLLTTLRPFGRWWFLL